MSNNLSLGIVIGAAVEPTVGRAFQSFDTRATALGRSLAQVRLGTAVASDVTRLTAELARLRAEETRVGNSDQALNRQIADTARQLDNARRGAGRYGVNLHDLDGETNRLRRSEVQLGAQLANTNRLRANQARRTEIGGRALGVVGAAFALTQPLKQAMTYEHELRMLMQCKNVLYSAK